MKRLKMDPDVAALVAGKLRTVADELPVAMRRRVEIGTVDPITALFSLPFLLSATSELYELAAALEAGRLLVEEPEPAEVRS